MLSKLGCPGWCKLAQRSTAFGPEKKNDIKFLLGAHNFFQSRRAATHRTRGRAMSLSFCSCHISPRPTTPSSHDAFKHILQPKHIHSSPATHRQPHPRYKNKPFPHPCPPDMDTSRTFRARSTVRQKGPEPRAAPFAPRKAKATRKKHPLLRPADGCQKGLAGAKQTGRLGDDLLPSVMRLIRGTNLNAS